MDDSNHRGSQERFDPSSSGDPIVSICVPIYNGEKYLEACFATIVAQTFGDFEVIVVDDCSTDRSAEIALQWAARDPRFTVHRNARNLGLVGNWNRAIGAARGVWIKLMFQDDLLDSRCLAMMLDHSAGSGGFIACARHLLYSGAVSQDARDWYAQHEAMLDRIYAGRTALSAAEFCERRLRHLDANIVGEPTVTLIRKDLLETYGLFDPDMVQVCDSDMWNRLGTVVGIRYIFEKLVTFRIHPESTSAKNGDQRFRGWVLDKIIEIGQLEYAPHYEGLRNFAGAAGLRRLLRMDLQARIREAFDDVGRSERRRPPDRIPRQQLRGVLDRFRGYRQEWIRFHLYRMIRVLQRSFDRAPADHRVR